ncbi:deoxyguanosinetriphosphate triphosphohydrolase [Sphaerotilus microaerophilus]|uniref:Deoxyguanosinetriphosphate triphosphohydrolase-like protein n=1 Tax=Sphaerotilus microaerophilus TaxID=2914710 RepID=A0ABN6PJZ9_9BURK|nr:deoxyguanosinetriphosphate triphosphohydrolase [Sphaerotilus sp. FB-5]BDI04414.1 deoxyguanosinetriphosphate triphosphohydrolase-like protein [Sphaerotilus sp. FB-5]
MATRACPPLAVPPATPLGAELAPYASDPARSRGRRHPELPAPTRNPYQRDRDRIVHSTAFRRLVYKTQVFLNHEGDLFRTRLTHTLEVAQLGRSIARSLGLHEDLVEAIALAHDLGHTPFGHAGQDALHACMAGHGGFEHNLQSLRVVDVLEQRYPAFDGLNLTFETREGILKHCALRVARWIERHEPGGVGARFLARSQPSLEAQLANLADEIAYNAHDVDDGVRSGLITLEQLGELPLIARFRDAALAEYPSLAVGPQRRLLFETLRRMLSEQVYDVIDATRTALQQHAPGTADEVRAAPPLVGFSPEMRQQSAQLKRFLFQRLYRHPAVMVTTERAMQVLRELFAIYVARPQEMPPDYAGSPLRERAVADYVSGMTDRFAIREHARLTGTRVFEPG